MPGQRKVKAKREERRNYVLKRTGEGATMRTIAKEIGKSIGTICNDLKIRLEQASEYDPSTQEYRRVQSERLEALIEEWQPRAKDDPYALDRLLRLFERQANLLKLDAPKQVELSGPGGGPIKTDGSLNLSALSNEEIQAFLAMMAKMKDTEGGDETEQRA